MEKLSFRAGEVEGPLDLILTLIARHKLNIYDIEISTLVEQYTAAVREMEEADLEVGSEFIEMGSQAGLYQDGELLPKHEKDEDPRRELTGSCWNTRPAVRQRHSWVPRAGWEVCSPDSPCRWMWTSPTGSATPRHCSLRHTAVPWARANGSNPRRQRCSVRWWQPVRIGGLPHCFHSAPALSFQPGELCRALFPQPGTQ